MMSQFMPGMARRAFSATTGEDGRFAIGHVQTGTYNVSASLAGFAPSVPQKVDIVAGRDVSNAEIVLTKGGRTQGQLTKNGEPLGNRMVQLIGPAGMQMVNTDAQGNYDISGLTPGTYMVNVVNMSAMASGGIKEMIKEGMDTLPMVVDIVDGQTTPLESAPHGDVTVNGTITGENLGNIVGVSLRRPGGLAPDEIDPLNLDMAQAIEAARNHVGQAVMNDDGTFSMPNIEPGKYILEVYSLNIDFNNLDPAALMNVNRKPALRQDIEITANQGGLNLVLPKTP